MASPGPVQGPAAVHVDRQRKPGLAFSCYPEGPKPKQNMFTLNNWYLPGGLTANQCREPLSGI